jgi:Dicarboxylate transport
MAAGPQTTDKGMAGLPYSPVGPIVCFMMKRRFARKRPAGRRVLRALLLCVLVLALAATGALVLRGREVAEHLIHALAERAGIAPDRLEVRAVGLAGLTLGPVQIGGPDGPAASAVEIGWTPWSLLHGRLGRVRVEGLSVNATIEQGELVIAGVPPGGGGGAATLPLEQLELADASFTLMAGTTKVSAALDATIAPHETGVMVGRATLDAVAELEKGAAIHAAADLPEWRLTADAGNTQLAIARATLALPDHQVALSGLDAVLQAGAAMSARVSGQLRDGSSPARFMPLAVTLQGQREQETVITTGRAATADNGFAVTLSGKHALATGRGTIEVATAPMKFVQDGLQPADIFPAIGDVVSRVEGTVSARGALSWGGALTSNAAVTLDNVAFDGGAARISDLGGTIRLASVMPPRTASAQRIMAKAHVAGLPPLPVDAQFSLSGDDRLVINAATVGFAGGTLGLANVALAVGKPVETELKIRAVDLGAVLSLLDIDGLSGSGTIEGQVPVRVDPGGAAIRAGQLVATGPGIMRYTGTGLPETGTDASASDPIKLMREALADFHYTGLTLTLDRAVSGEGSLLVHLEGANPQVLDNHPFVFNIRLDANFDKLAAILFSGYAAAEDLVRRSMRP